jgi:lipoate-protein ligase A
MWTFLNSGYSSGAINMAVDESLAHSLCGSDLDGVVRVYGWIPPCVSLGYHQRIETFDLEKLRKERIDVVRRPTGGRAILHWEELTYSVVIREDGRPLSEVYHLIGNALVHGLQILNSEISLAKPDAGAVWAVRPVAGIPCYTSTARFEIQHRGKKLVGSAQRRYNFVRDESSENSSGSDEVVLQHGSILIGPAHRRLAEFLTLDGEEHIVAVAKELAEKSTELSTVLGRPVEFEEVAQCVRSGFEEEWGIDFSDVLKESEYPLSVH